MATRSSPDDLMAEFAETVPYYKVFIARLRARLRAKLAEIQTNEEGAGDPLAPSVSLMSMFDGTVPAVVPVVPRVPEAGETGADEDAIPLMVLPQTETAVPPSDPTTTVEPSAQPLTSTDPTVSVEREETAPLTNLQEAQLALDHALSEKVILTLPAPLRAAWRERSTNPERWAQVLLSAEEARLLSDAAVHALAGMVKWDSEFRGAFDVFTSGEYPELFDIDWVDEVSEADEDAPDEDAPEEDDEGDGEDGEANEAVERGEEPF